MEGFYDNMNLRLVQKGCTAIINVQVNLDEPSSYPVRVYNVYEQLIGTANNKQQILDLWNSDGADQAIGRLSGYYGPFTFLLEYECGKEIPDYIGQGGFIEFAWIDSDQTAIVDGEDNSKISLL
jgi:hypothetical protein